MLIETARRAEAAVKEMLAEVTDGAVSCEEIREALLVSKAIAGINSAFQSAAAASVAGRERHGDGGAEVLAASTGLSRGEARNQVKTSEALSAAPVLRDALAAGRLTQGNARRLAEAVKRHGAAAVGSDGGLLAKAESMRADDFAKAARRWVSAREGDNGASEHARQRARRQVRVWDGDDGMVHLRGEFDTVSGTRIANRLRNCASQMYDADNKNASNKNTNNGGGRSFDQCMADALDTLTATDNSSGGGKPYADICVVAHVDDATGKLVAELPDDSKLPEAVLEELACTAKFTGVIYDRGGRAIWRAHSLRCATNSQRQMLIARDKGCFGCGAHPGVCDAHHVNPVSQGGTTSLDNLVLACWRCHHKIHHLGWQIHGPPGNRTLHPPETMHYGPAAAPDQPPPLFRPDSRPGAAQSPSPSGTDDAVAPRSSGPAAARAALRRARSKHTTPNATHPDQPGPDPPESPPNTTSPTQSTLRL